MTSITLVEDDELLRENFTELLSDEGFEVQAFADSQSALAHFEHSLPNLVLLDVSLGTDTEAGFHICLELRKRSQSVPIIFFSSHDSEFDKISGLRLGADDYLTKDISLDYLVIRIKALLRRVEALSQGVSSNTEDNDTNPELKLDMNTLKASWKGEFVNLSLTQVWIIQSLTTYPGHVKSHQQLMDAAKLTVEPNTIAAHIKNIREQFKQIDKEFNCIKTERGIGYRWMCN